MTNNVEAITVTIEIDTTELEKSLQLAKELETTLEKANRLLDQLTSGKNERDQEHEIKVDASSLALSLGRPSSLYPRVSKANRGLGSLNTDETH